MLYQFAKTSSKQGQTVHRSNKIYKLGKRQTGIRKKIVKNISLIKTYILYISKEFMFKAIFLSYTPKFNKKRLHP